MPTHTDAENRLVDQWRAYLECLTHIHVDPRLRRRFGWSDIVQRTILEAWKDLEILRELDSPAQQRRLRHMFRNNLLERIKHEQADRRDYRREQSLDESFEQSSSQMLGWLGGDESTPPEKLAERERALRLAEAMAQLPKRQREALLLQHWHRYKLRDISEHLDCTMGAVAGLLAHGMAKLHQLLPDDLLE
jgi:RNA polymerase sigma-70 factor (subfamily 1)